MLERAGQVTPQGDYRVHSEFICINLYIYPMKQLHEAARVSALTKIEEPTMKTLTVLLTLISMTALVQGHAAAQAIDRSLVCENVSFTVNNVGKRAILVVDVRYLSLIHI